MVSDPTVLYLSPSSLTKIVPSGTTVPPVPVTFTVPVENVAGVGVIP